MKVFILLFTLALGACSFFGKQAPLSPHYYDAAPSSEGGQVAPSGQALRLGHVVGASHLRERVAYHVSERELAFYEDRRWTELPENYLRRALVHELFERRGLTQVVSGVAPTLEVELTDFSELTGSKHGVRAKLRAMLVDARAVHFEHTFVAEVAVAGNDFDGVPQALGEALAQLVSQVAERVIGALPLPTTP
ncbi:MAG TPA: ABC-type transport auxiliary lipoprotein family protein [Polyangiales bacterium]